MRIAVITQDSREHYRDYANPSPYFGTAPAALLQGFETLMDHEVHVVSCTMVPMQSPEKLAPNIWFHSLHVPKIGWMRTGYQGCVRSVRRRLRNIGPQIVHGQGTERFCALSAVLSGFPSVITLHGNMRIVARVNRARFLSFDWITARLESLTIPRAKGVVCITSHTQRAVADLAKKTWIVPNAVDTSFLEVKRQLPGAEAPVILCVGSVCHHKNQNRLIRALDPLAARRPFSLIFLGAAYENSPYGGEFFNLIRQRPWCTHEGFASREHLKQWLSRAAFLVLPSLEDNCPMVVLEAFAAGVPAVASRAGGIPDLVQEERTGLLFDPLDPETMCRAVERALTDGPLMQQLGNNVKAATKERYLPGHVAQQHIVIYKEVLKSLPTART